MWMIWKARNVIIRIVAAKRVQHQERIETLLKILRQDPGEFDTGTIGGGLANDQLLHAA
jgi:hypothetical protein